MNRRLVTRLNVQAPGIRLGAEALGTLLLVFFGGGALLTAAGGFFGGVMGFTLALAIAVWVFGPVSGGHFNPWITLAVAVRGWMGWADAARYAGAQIVGGVLGALFLWAVYGSDGVTAGLGATRLSPRAGTGAGLISALLAEGIATFVLVCAFFALTTEDRPARKIRGIGLGLTFGLGMLSIGAVTGGSMNLARTLGPELVLTLAGGATAWGDIWVYLLGPAAGAAAAAIVYGAVAAAPAVSPMAPTRR